MYLCARGIAHTYIHIQARSYTHTHTYSCTAEALLTHEHMRLPVYAPPRVYTVQFPAQRTVCIETIVRMCMCTYTLYLYVCYHIINTWYLYADCLYGNACMCTYTLYVYVCYYIIRTSYLYIWYIHLCTISMASCTMSMASCTISMASCTIS